MKSGMSRSRRVCRCRPARESQTSNPIQPNSARGIATGQAPSKMKSSASTAPMVRVAALSSA